MTAVATRLRVLLVEDCEDDAVLLTRELRGAGYDVHWQRVDSEEALCHALAEREWDLVLSDHALPGFSGVKALAACRSLAPDVPFLLVSGHVGEETAIRLLKAGAGDVVAKDRLGRLVPAVERELADARVRRERAWAEAALQESEATLRSFYEHAPFLMGIAELLQGDLLRIYENPASGELFGGGSDPLVFPGRLPDAWADHCRTCRRTGAPLRFDHEDAATGRWFSVSLAPLAPGRSGMPRFCYVAEDVTERRRLEEGERARERYFRSLTENSTDLVTILDEDYRAAYESPSLTRMLGYAPKDLIGSQPLDLVHPDDQDRVREELARAKREPEYSPLLRYRFRHQDGSWRILESTGRNLLADPAVRGLVVNTRDVTETVAAEEALRRSEDQLRQAQRMEAVGRLAGGIAHDFNNLLTAIGGTTELLMEEHPDCHDLAEIKRAVHRAASLTRQLLTFSRRQVVQPRLMQLEETLGSTERLLRRLIGEDIRLVVELGGRTSPVFADPGQMELVLMNLVVNSRDAMPEGGEVRLVTDSVRLETCLPSPFGDIPAGSYVRLTVSDTGVGIPQDVLPFILDPFFTTKEPGRGTGLGLSTVYGIVKQARGHLSVRTGVGEGTRFEILLPAAVGEPTAEEPTSTPKLHRGGSETILVAEDEPAVRGLIRKVLEREGYRVLEATSGSEALRMIEEHPGDLHLVLTDVVMPDVGGRQLGEKLRDLRPRTRVVYMSGYTQDEVLQQGIRNQDMEFLEKPFTPGGLALRVREVLDRP